MRYSTQEKQIKKELKEVDSSEYITEDGGISVDADKTERVRITNGDGG